MNYSIVFTPTFVNHTFKRYQDIVLYNKRHPEDNVLVEYKQATKNGYQDYVYGDPHLKTSKPTSSSKFCRSVEEHKEFSRAERYATCMDIAHGKGCAVSRVKVLASNPSVDFCHYPQGFDPDVEICDKVSLFSIWKQSSDFMQVSTGITHLFRDILIVDIDNHDHSCSLATIYSTLESYGLPCPNYIITHHKKDHDTFQIGFLMENHLRVKECIGKTYFSEHSSHRIDHSRYYMDIVHTLNTIFPGDINFTGWWCKNPYYCQNDSSFSVQFFSEEAVSSWVDMRLMLGISLTNCKLNIKPTSKPLISNVSSSSRNYHLRMFIASQVRQHQGHFSESECLSLCLSNSKEFAHLAGKCEAQSPDEITRVVHSSFNHFLRSYKPLARQSGSNSKESQYSDVSRSASALKRSLSRFYKQLSVYNLLAVGTTRSEILSILGLDSAHFSRYNKSESFLRSEITRLLSEFQSTKSFFGSSNSNQGFWFKAIYDLERLQRDFTPQFIASYFSETDSSYRVLAA